MLSSSRLYKSNFVAKTSLSMGRALRCAQACFRTAYLGTASAAGVCCVKYLMTAVALWESFFAELFGFIPSLMSF